MFCELVFSDLVMKKTIIISLLCLLCGGAMQAQKIRIKTGIEVLKEQNFRCLEGKRVGLITNPRVWTTG